MDEKPIALLIPIFVSLGFFLLIFGIVYLRNKEKMAMIERGMDPRIQVDNTGTRNYVLTAAMLLIGSGIGLFIAFFIDHEAMEDIKDTTAIYFSLISFFGGLGLLSAYIIEKRTAKQ